MSWAVKRNRFQRNIEKYPENLKKHFYKKKNISNLPTLKNLFPDPIPNAQRKTAIEAGIMEGDMAYVTAGKFKGKIAEVITYFPEYDCVALSNITSKRIIPKFFWPEGHESHVFDFPTYIPMKDIRLAAKDKDEKGTISYVVAEELEFKDKYYDDRFKKFIPRRFVKHHDNIEIPWPEPRTLEDGPLSTPENVVRERTYEFHTIAKTDIPKAAMSQLRNPFSKYKKRILSEFQVAKLKGPDMPLTVEQKIWLARNEEKAKTAKPRYYPLLDEVQEFIGAKMAEHMNKIESPELRRHLEVLSNRRNIDFEKTLKIIEETKIAESEAQAKFEQTPKVENHTTGTTNSTEGTL